MIEECLAVEFRVTGDDCPLADAIRELDASVDCRPSQARSNGNALLRFSADADVEALAERLDRDNRIRYLHASHVDGIANLRCLSKHPCVVHRLVDVGFMAESLQYRRGTETYLGAVVGHDALRGVPRRGRRPRSRRIPPQSPARASSTATPRSRFGRRRCSRRDRRDPALRTSPHPA